MSDKATCPACDSHTSEIYRCFEEGAPPQTPRWHAQCTFCQPTAPGPTVALCGETYNSDGGSRDETPPNCCLVCLLLWDRPCARCGH